MAASVTGDLGILPKAPAGPAPTADLAAYIKPADEGGHRLHLMVENVHCGGCLRKIEREIGALPGVESARLNLTTRRLAVSWRGDQAIGGEVLGRLQQLGYPARPYDPQSLGSGDAKVEKNLLRAMAVAGFAAANVMLLSVSVWAGVDMGAATRSLLHWFSALIVLPAVVYAGRPFFESALGALARRQTNMDVPISLAIMLASGMSLFETTRGGEHVYFESAIMLLFFLLLGRYLDRRARGKARQAAEHLLSLDQGKVTVLDADGKTESLPVSAVALGMTVLVAPGERIGVDGRIASGRTDIDSSLITGEAEPAPAEQGERVFAGTLNLTAPIEIEVTAVGESTLLAEIVRLMELAEQKRGRYVVLADRIAGWYAPVVHGLALVTFLGWTLLFGAAWQTALLYAISVLIITCPCALGLAVPAVQVIASGRLLQRGILLKSATALERLATVTTVVFDKTGTLTEGRPTLRGDLDVTAADLDLAASLAAASRHPLARAIAAAAPDARLAAGVEEVPGMGLRLATDQGEVRLGSRRWCDVDTADADDATGPELWLRTASGRQIRFTFDDPLRSDAAEVIADLRRAHVATAILSGDRQATVSRVAERLGIEQWQAACTPADKVLRLQRLADDGERVLMVGDGLNDAAALAAAHVSLSPASAVDISQAAADAVFQGSRLQPVEELVHTARHASRLVRQNLVLALGYNMLTIPLAVAGMVTPLIAAVCMSASSLIVVGNALRLGKGGSA
ncbi:MAG: heavy metal translocating P-type ATPase [Alphaproteobacteria bacterium]